MLVTELRYHVVPMRGVAQDSRADPAPARPAIRSPERYPASARPPAQQIALMTDGAARAVDLSDSIRGQGLWNEFRRQAQAKQSRTGVQQSAPTPKASSCVGNPATTPPSFTAIWEGNP